MVVDAPVPRNPRDDRMSDCRSIGSNYHPSSQSRKISIGILVDSLAKKRSGAAKEDEVAVPDAERLNHNVENKGQGVTAAVKGKQSKAPEQENSPWITTRTFHNKAPTSETVLHAVQPATNGSQNKLNGLKDAPATYSVQFFADKRSILQSGEGKQNNSNEVTYKRKGVKDGTTEKVEDSKLATAQEVHMSDKVVIEDKADKTENRTETLRMKLWEILGNVSSPNNQCSNPQSHEDGPNISSPNNQYSNPQSHEDGANNLKPERNFDKKGDTVVRPRQNSDTIETDSEGPDHIIRRPVTRSLTRKRAPTKVKPKVTKGSPSLGYRQKHQEKNIFSFDVGQSGRVNAAVNGGSSKPLRKNSSEPLRKKGEKKSFRIEPSKICFPQKDNAARLQGANYKSETLLLAKKTSSLGNKMGDRHGCVPKNNREYLGPENNVQEQDLHPSPLIDKTDLREDFNSSANGDQQKDIANPSLKRFVDPQDDLQSPTFGIKTPILSFTPNSTPKTDQLVHGVRGPALAERRSNVGDIRSFRTLQTEFSDDAKELQNSPVRKSAVNIEEKYTEDGLSESSPKEHGVCSPAVAERRSNVGDIRSFRTFQRQFSDDAKGLKNSPVRKSSANIEEKYTEDGQSESSSEEDCESSEEGSPIIEEYNRCSKRATFSPESGDAEKPNFLLRPTKRLRTHEGIRFDDTSPTLPSPKGTGESNWIYEPLEQSQEDVLLRAIKLFALELEKLQSKMKSETSKKSSEILTSVADGIYLQLQNLESHIQTDLGKLTSLSKSKRKRLETEFEEQQKELKLIHERFKEDVNHHLQDFRSTLEGLEAHHIEFKGTLEKQKASHRKLLLQVEETVQTQLNNAHGRIAAIHELSRGKMLQLKHVIASCLKDGFLS